MKRSMLCGWALAALAGVPARAAEDGNIGAVVDAAETVLVNGRPRPETAPAQMRESHETRDGTLVVPDEPLHVPAADGLFRTDLTQAGAAEHLRMLVERAAVVSPPEAPEGLKIIEHDGDVYLLGEIAPAGTNNWPGAIDRGVMHAVETFAERVMGYRFLVSTPDDEEL